jgi:hypothetical protein
VSLLDYAAPYGIILDDSSPSETTASAQTLSYSRGQMPDFLNLLTEFTANGACIQAWQNNNKDNLRLSRNIQCFPQMLQPARSS